MSQQVKATTNPAIQERIDRVRNSHSANVAEWNILLDSVLSYLEDMYRFRWNEESFFLTTIQGLKEAGRKDFELDQIIEDYKKRGGTYIEPYALFNTMSGLLLY